MLIGVDVGGTNLRVGAIDQLKVVEEQRIQADFSGLCRSQPPAQAEQSIRRILADALTAALQKYPEASGIGLGFPGFIDPVSGRVLQSPNLPGLSDVDLATPLREILGVPVIIENDALAAAYGEYRLLALPGRSMIYLGLGTGVGGGLIVDGAPFPGEHGVAMEVGHIIVAPEGRPCGCGNNGCMEQYASASGVALSYFESTGRHATAHQVAQQAAAGELAALAAFDLAGSALAQALAHILKVVDVGHILVGGGMSGAWQWMAPSFERRLNADLIPALRGKINISVSQAGDQAGMVGAALLSLRHIP